MSLSKKHEELLRRLIEIVRESQREVESDKSRRERIKKLLKEHLESSNAI